MEDLQKALFERFNIQVEKSTFNTLTLLLTIGTTRSKVSRLYDALMRIAREGHAPRRLVQTPEIPAFTRLRFPPRDAYYCGGELIPVFDERERVHPALAGRIAADQIVPYPPGIPVLVPGQLVTRSIVEYLGGLLHSHKRMEMHGIVHEGYVPCIRVLKAEEVALVVPPAVGESKPHQQTNTEDVDVRLAGRVTAHVGVPLPSARTPKRGLKLYWAPSPKVRSVLVSLTSTG